MADFSSQIATVKVCPTGGFHHALSIPELSIPCVYVLVWFQGLTHYSNKFKEEHISDLRGINPMPIFGFSSLAFEWALRASWAQLRAVIVKLPVRKKGVLS